ncbi:MAG: hypothetical protein J4G04_04955 [Nitrosopumilaceae archaeon]|nr:hypothetical protein [Nitrosopumilaceae archaeon]
MDFSVGVIIAMGLLVAGVMGLIVMDPGPLPEPVIVEPMEEQADMETDVEPMEEQADMETDVEPMESGPQTHTVVIAEGSSLPGCEETDECYLPHTVTINVGDTVLWENPDPVAHTVTSIADGAPDGMFESGLFLTDTTFEVNFDEPGTYDYFCIVHPWMVGAIIVE